MKGISNETVAAVSTSYSEGGIGIVRISGDASHGILDKIFRRADLRAEGYEDRRMYYGHVEDAGEIVDEALAVYMKAPRTYTGEDVVEIQCHGGQVCLRRILELALREGAAFAGPGEFTKRAFLNGRIDLTRAEAVVDLVRAKTDAGARAAASQLAGRLSENIVQVRDLLADALAEAVLNMDYPDEDEDLADDASAVASISAKLREAAGAVDSLLAQAEAGRFLRDGVGVVLAGKANVGKSSLLNALLRDARAIVTDMPGTTRDSIEEYVNVRGVPVSLTDTAGLREAEDDVERLGVARSLSKIASADVVAFLVDGSEKLDEGDVGALKLTVKSMRDANRSALVIVVNKSDLPVAVTEENVARFLRAAGEMDASRVIALSAQTGEGVTRFEDALVDVVGGGNFQSGESPLVTNARHKDLLTKAASEIDEALRILAVEGVPDLSETHARAAYEDLGEIIGATVTDEILDRVFSKFCVGK